MQSFVPFRTRLAVAGELRRSGMGIVKAHRLASIVDEDFIANAVAGASVEIQTAFAAATAPMGGPLSDLLQMFLDFLSSPLGQQLLQLLLSLLLGL